MEVMTSPQAAINQGLRGVELKRAIIEQFGTIPEVMDKLGLSNESSG